jgi:poly(glycerol-phosphate) alpha-glucosyltransferase
MRVAELTTHASRLNGGVFYALTALLPTVARTSAGTELRVFAFADRHLEEDRDAWSPLAVAAFSPWRPRLFGYSPRLVPALTGYGPDLIHAHGLWTYLSAASLAVHRRTDAPMIVSPHGMLDPWALGFSRFRKRVAGKLFQDGQLRAAAVLHALTAAEARDIRAYGLANPIVVIPNGVSAPGRPVEARSSCRASGGRNHSMLYLGRIHPKKGLAQLIGAWADFSRPGGVGACWRLTVAGWDEVGHEARLRALASARGAADSVEFAGPLFGAAKEAALEGADAFVLPSLSEGLPMAVLEAWARGKPALITTACNLPEGAAAGAAIEVEPTSAGLANGLKRIAELSDSARSSMGAAGRRLAGERFSWERIAADMSRVYAAVASREPPPGDLLFAEARADHA